MLRKGGGGLAVGFLFSRESWRGGLGLFHVSERLSGGGETTNDALFATRRRLGHGVKTGTGTGCSWKVG